MDVHKAGDDALVTVIVVHILGAIGQDGGDPAVIHLNSSRDELVCQPDLLLCITILDALLLGSIT